MIANVSLVLVNDSSGSGHNVTHFHCDDFKTTSCPERQLNDFLVYISNFALFVMNSGQNLYLLNRSKNKSHTLTIDDSHFIHFIAKAVFANFTINKYFRQ